MKLKLFFIFLTSCFSLAAHSQITTTKQPNEPLYFIDSINVTKAEVQQLLPEVVIVKSYKDSTAIKLVGEKGKHGVIYMETKTFARNRYWNYLKNKSPEYAQAVKNPESDSLVAYIINGRLLTKNVERELSEIDDKNFVELKVMDKATLTRKYKVLGKKCGIQIFKN